MQTACVGVQRIVGAALVAHGRVLLCHRSPDRPWYPNVWDLPGGHVEAGEHPEEALQRELLEELGVDVGPVVDEPILHIRDDALEVDLTVWLVTGWTGDPVNRQAEEHDEIGWFGPGDLPELALADERFGPLLAGLLDDR